MPSPATNSAIKRGLSSDFVPSDQGANFLDVSKRMGSYVNAHAVFMNAPAIRGFWPSFNRSDTSPSLFALGLSNTPEWVFDTSFRPYTHFTGANDDALTGTSSLFNVDASLSWSDQEGLYFGAWVRFTTIPTTNMGIIGNWISFGNEKSYRIYKTSGNKIGMSITIDGGNQFNATVEDVVETGVWYFVAAIFVPSTSITLFSYDSADGTTRIATNTTSIPASLYQTSPVVFALGRDVGIASATDYNSLDGDMCFSFFCPVQVSTYWPYMMRQVSEPYVTGFSD